MDRTNKSGDWKELLLLKESDFFGNFKGAEIAVRITFSYYGRELRFSHTPGIINRDGRFQPVQNLHDRKMNAYLDIFTFGRVAIESAKELNPETIVLNSEETKKSLKKAFNTISQEAEEYTKRVEKKKKPITNPTFGVSIGEMLQAKQKESME